MTPIDTAELERLLDTAARHRTNVAQFLEAVFDRGHVTKDMFDAAHSDDEFAQDELRSMAEALAFEVLAHRKAEAWQPISSAPFHTPVIVRVGRMTFPAILRGNAAMDENGQDCAQWQAVNEGEHPPCWSDGACWASNADGLTSLQPTGWKPATPEAEGGCDERA